MGMGFVVVTNPQDIGTPSESVEFCGMQNLQEGSAEESLGSSSNSSDSDGGSNAASMMIRCDGMLAAIFAVAMLWSIY